jgi:hypothetical protein
LISSTATVKLAWLLSWLCFAINDDASDAKLSAPPAVVSCERQGRYQYVSE